MRSLISAVLLFIAINSSAQNISGLYSGTLINDSLKMVQNYELALSEYKGKITGFSYITFVSNDTFYYGIKRIKAIRKNGELVVEDVEMLMNNYPQRPDKGVHLINRIPLPPGQDTILNMNGRWETTENKKRWIRSINGALNLRRDDDSLQSPLIAHLKELKVINYQDDKKESKNIAKTEVKQKPKEVKTEPREVALKENKPEKVFTTQDIVEEKPSAEIIAKRKPSPKPSSTEDTGKPTEAKKEIVASQTTASETKPKEVALQQTQPKPAVVSQPVIKEPVATETKTLQDKAPVTTASTTEIKTRSVSTPESQKPSVTSVVPEKQKEPAPTSIASEKPKALSQKETKETAVKNNEPKNAEPTVVQTSNVTEIKPTISASEPSKTISDLSPVVKRVTNTIQTVNVASDSLILTFYDNGVVDGDSISVYLNDQNIISKVKLSEAAVKKTIFTNNVHTDGIRLTLVAENLGSIPPNTGLLIIQDGSDRYQIRFSADMQTNASVIIKKKQ